MAASIPRALARHWFLLLLAAALLGGPLEPGPGRALAPHVGLLIVAILFAMSLTLPLARLVDAARDVRVHLLCAAITYGLYPALCYLVARLLFPGDEELAAGLTILGALPLTLASAAVWTRAARGNDAVPMVFTALSNGLSFLVLPAILWLTLREWVAVDAGAMGMRLLTRVLVPIAAGQAVRALLPRLAEATRSGVSLLARLLVLLIVLIAVSRASDEIRAEPLAVAALLAATLAIHVAALAAARQGARILSIPRPDAIGALFAASQKSLYVGVYVAAEFYPDLPGALIPLVAAHVTQLAFDTLVAERLARRG